MTEHDDRTTSTDATRPTSLHTADARTARGDRTDRAQGTESQEGGMLEGQGGIGQVDPQLTVTSVHVGRPGHAGCSSTEPQGDNDVSKLSIDLEAVRKLVDQLEKLAQGRGDDELDKIAANLRLALGPVHGEDQAGPMIEGQGVARGQAPSQQISLGPAARLTIEIFR